MTNEIDMGFANSDTFQNKPLAQGFQNREPGEWGKLIGSLSGVSMFYFAATGFGNCAASPSIPYFILVFALANLINGCLKFYYNIPESPDGQATHPNKGAVHASQGIGILLLGSSIWGGIVIYPKISEVGLAEGNGCDKTVFLLGFFLCTLVLSIVSVMAVVGVVKKFPKK